LLFSFCAPESVGGDVPIGLPSVTMRRYPASFGDLRKQRLVVDLKDPRGCGTVPAHALEHFQERLAFGGRPEDDAGFRFVNLLGERRQSEDRRFAVDCWRHESTSRRGKPTWSD
jgi:hypothetical protein